MMPYHISEDGLCVMKDGESEPVKCHPDKDAALAHLRALMANVSDAAKAGARHSTGDIKKGRGVKAKAREIVQDMDDLGFPDEHQVGHPADAAKSDALPPSNDAPIIFGAVKAAGDWELDVLYLPYGGQKDGKDSQGEYFSARTNDHADKFPSPVILYYHGYTPEGQPQGNPEVIGKALKRWADNAGRWVKIKLDQANQYARRIWDSAQTGAARASSGSIAHLVRREADGHLTNWPVVEISLIDVVGKRQPANTYAVAMPAAKAHLELGGLSLPTEFNSATPQATGAGSAAEPSAQSQLNGENEMEEKQVAELVAAALKADREQRDAAEKAENDRKAAEQTRIDAAVKAAEEKAAKELAALKAQYVASGRLAMGDPNGAPAQGHFRDTNRYDGLGMGDLAFAAGILDAVKRGDASNRGASKAMLKALAIKIAEDKTEIGVEGRGAMKAAGLEPDRVLDAAKADELNYSTQTGYGDEWVPTVWSPSLWLNVRAMTFVLEKIPQRSYDVPGDTFTYPLEGADPTWYLIPQTTDIDSTNRRPNATIGDSKVATSNINGTFAKVGARILFSGEYNEDSLIPWVPQLRAQTERSFAEQMEHLVIDGDTETAATTNINHIGGTPTNTGTKRDLFLALNGFRKSCLVTTTANSRSGSGTLVDTDFMETAWLLGAAGLIGGDPTKVDFIVDPNVSKKAAYLASVKTKDVFTTATLENGLLRAIWGYKVFTSWFMHWRSTTNPREANTAGKVDLTTQANNTTGAILAVRWDQWFFGYKRRMMMKLQDIPDSDAQQLIATARVGLLQRDTEGSAETYNVGI